MKIYKLPQMTNYKTLFDWICGLQQYPELILPEHDIQCDVYSPLAMLVYLCTQRIVPFLVTVVQCDGYLRICHGQHELQALRLFYENKLPVNQTQWYSSTPFFFGSVTRLFPRPDIWDAVIFFVRFGKCTIYSGA